MSYINFSAGLAFLIYVSMD